MRLRRFLSLLPSFRLSSLLLSLAVFALFSSAEAYAQKKEHPSAPVERKVVTDEAGLQQWADFKAAACIRCRTSKKIECPTCKDLEHAKSCLECGSKKVPMPKKAPCRLCAGEGTMPDPLVEAPCLGCFGSSVFPCYGCSGEGGYPVEGGGKRRQKCAVCKGAGALKCGICKGKRRCSALSLKKGIADANLKDLRKASETITEILGELRSWNPIGVKARVELKKLQAWHKQLAKHAKVFKKASSTAKSLFGSISKMDTYRGSEERKAAVFKRFASYNAFYLDHQLQMLKLAIARAEHNEQVAKKAKSK